MPVRIDLVVELSPADVDPVSVVTNALAAHGCKIAKVDPAGMLAISTTIGGNAIRYWTPVSDTVPG